MLPTPLPADDAPAEETSERLADLDDRLRGGAPEAHRHGAAKGPRLAPDEVDLLLRLNQAGAAHRERASRRPLEAPVRFGRFEIVGEAGRGGFATVYEAIDGFLRRRVALKVAHPGVLVSEALRGRFLREAELASRLAHPALVTIHEFGEEEGLCYIVEEFCDGGTLASWLERRGPVEPKVAAAVVLALAEGLAVAHAAGISHRDIKPENVLLAAAVGGKPVIEGTGGTPGWTVKLGDFGLGKLADEEPAGTPLVQLTREGARIGTPAWMAPEQIDRAIGPVGPATDVHALGLLLDRLLAGRSRWAGGSDAETLRMILLGDPEASDRRLPGVPADLSAVVARCLAKDPAERYPSAAALASDLARFLLGLPTVARPVTHLERAWRVVARRPVTTAIVATSLLLALGLVHGLRDRARQAAEIERGRIERARLDAVLDLRRASDMVRSANAAAAVEHLRAAGTSDPSLVASWGGRWIERRIHGETALLLAPPADGAQAAPGEARPALHCVAVASDGRTVAAGGADGLLRLVSLDPTGRPVAPPIEVPAHDEINDVAFSPDSSLVATAGEDGRVRLFHAADGSASREVASQEAALFAVAFTPDGTRIAWGGAERSIRLAAVGGGAAADGASPLVLRPFAADATVAESDIESMRFLDDRRIVVACGPRIVVVDTATGSIERAFVGHDPNGVVGHLALSADGTRLLAAGTEPVPRVWDVATGRLLLSLPRHPSWIQGGGFSADGARIVTGCKDGVLRVFDAASGAELHKLAGHVGRIWDATCDRSGAALSAGADGTLRRWDPGRRTELAGTREVPVAGGAIRDVVAVPDAAVATGAPEGGAAASLDGADKIVILPRRGAPALIDPATGERRDLTAGDTGPSRFLSIDPHGRRFVLHGVDEQTTLHAVDGGPGRSLHTAALLSAWTGSGRLVVADLDRTLSVWDEALERPATIDSFGHLVDALAPSPPPLELLAVGAGDVVRLHAIPPRGLSAAGGGKTLVRLPAEFGKAYRIAWSRDGTRLAVGSSLGRVAVLDVARPRLLDTFASHPREIVSLAWSPDDRLLFSADQELLRVSDTATTVMIDEIRPGFDIGAALFVGGEGAPERLVVAGGNATAGPADDSDSVARLLVVDFDR